MTSAIPRNIQVMANRLSAFSKNTLQLAPQTKQVYSPSDTISFRLPANALLDLHTATLRFDIQYTNTTGTALNPVNVTPFEMIAGPPRFTDGFFRRIDVQMGSTTVGLTGCSDYGGVATLLGLNSVPDTKTEKDLNWLEAGGEVPFLPYDGGPPNAELLAAYQPEAARGSRYYLPAPWASATNPAVVGTAPNLAPVTRNDTYLLRHFLGVMGGQYFRLLDTNLLPDVIVNFQIAQKEVIQATDVGSVTWQLTNASLRFETLNFGDGTYRALVDRRLSQGPITMPFSNFYTFEGSLSGSSSIQTQFTVASQCINGILATLRPGAYDTHMMPSSSPYAGCSQIVTDKRTKQTNSPGCTYYQFTCGRDPGTHLLTSQVCSRVNGLNNAIVWPIPNQPTAPGPTLAAIGSLWLDDRSQSPNFQLTVDSKNYPQVFTQGSAWHAHPSVPWQGCCMLQLHTWQCDTAHHTSHAHGT